MLAKRLDRAFLKYRDKDDGRALAEVFDLIANDLFRFAAHLSKSQEQAEDLVQATFLRAIEKRASYRAEGKLFSWLAGILANEWKEERRRAGRPLDFERLRRDLGPDSSVPVENEELKQQLREALAGLPEPYRGVLDLKYGENMKSSAIAARLKRPEGTVRAQISRGLEFLRRILPASLLGVFASSLSPRLQGQVRQAVLTHAGFQPVAGIASLAALKMACLLSTIAALFSLPFFLDGNDELDLNKDSNSLVVEEDPSLAPRRHEIRSQPGLSEENDATAVAETGAAELPGWKWYRHNPIAKLPNRKTVTTGQWRFGPLPAGLSETTFRAGLAGATIPPSTVLSETTFGALEDFPQSEENWSIVPDGHHLAQVFYDDVSWGHLMMVPLGRRDREREMGRYRASTYESEFEIWLKDPDLLAETPIALLQGREGLVRMHFQNDGKTFKLLETAPLPLEVEFRLKDGETFRVCMWKNRLKLDVLAENQPQQQKRFRLLSLDTQVPVEAASVTYVTPGIPRLAWDLKITERGDFVEPEIDWKTKDYAQLRVKHEGFMPQRLSLRKFLMRRDDEGRFLVYLMPKFERPGLLLDNNGEALPGAQLRVMIDNRHQEILSGFSDGQGQFSLSMSASYETHSGLGISDFDTAVDVLVETADGRHASLDELSLRSLFQAPTLKLPAGPRRLDVLVQSENGAPVARARVGIAPSKANELVQDQKMVDFATTNSEGRCRSHGICAELVDVLVEVEGQAPLNQRLEVPADGQLIVTIPATTTVTIKFNCSIDVPDFSKIVQASYREVGEERGLAQEGLITVSPSGEASFAAPLGSHFDLSFRQRSQGPKSELSYRISPQSYESVAAGDVIEVKIVPGKLRSIELETTSKPLRSALVYIESDIGAEISPWELRNEGFGGAWQERAPLNFPLGSTELTIIAPGHRIVKAGETTTRDSAGTLHYRLQEGPRAQGQIVNMDKSLSQVLNFELLEVTAVRLPETFLKSLNQTAQVHCIADAEGHFETPALIPGRYRVSMRGKTWTEIVVETDGQEFVFETPR